MSKIELLKANLIDQLSDESKRAGTWCWYYKYEQPIETHYDAWVSYRLWVMQCRRAVADMTIDEFRFALHSNWLNIQTALFGKS